MALSIKDSRKDLNWCVREDSSAREVWIQIDIGNEDKMIIPKPAGSGQEDQLVGVVNYVGLFWRTLAVQPLNIRHGNHLPGRTLPG